MFDYSIKCGESLISVQQNIKYLGLNIDDKLNFKEHIKIIERKVAYAVGILAKSKHYLPRDILLQLYHALIYYHLIYAIPVWGSTFHTYFDKLIAYLNKAVKTIAKAKWNDSPSPRYNELGILKLAKIYQLEVAKIMHRIDTKKHPPSLIRYFQKSGLSHSYSTLTVSFSQLLHIPLFKTTKLQKSFLHLGVKIWNSIPSNIKLLSYTKFKSLFKPNNVIRRLITCYFLPFSSWLLQYITT